MLIDGSPEPVLLARDPDHDLVEVPAQQAHLLIGRILLRAGRPQEALDALKISVWSADSAAAHVALAEAYLKLQNVPSARAQLERALALDPSSADAKRILSTIR